MPFLNAVVDVLLELSPWLLLGAVLSGLIHVLVPKRFVSGHFSGASGVVKSVLLGIPLPLCSCGVIPAGVGLKKDGASDGASVGFLIATPQTGVDSVLVSASFLGWPFALWKVGAALVTGIAGGWVTEAVSPSETHEVTGGGSRPSLRDGVSHSVEVVRSIWRWLLFGILVSAALSAWLPPDAFVGLAARGAALAFLAALLISLPLYVCATASVPIAAALVAGGMPTGAALVFLMAGPATNVATLGAVARTFGRRVLGVYLGTIVIGSIVFGLGFEAVFGELTAAAVHAHAHTSWWHQVSAVVLVAMMIGFAVEELRGALSARRAADAASTVVVPVEGMSCNGCANRLQRTLVAMDGVEGAAVSLESREARIEGPVHADVLLAAIRDAGFEPGELREAS